MTEQTERNWDLRHPVDDLDEALRHLRRPFEPAAVRWKIQTVFGNNNGAIIVSHIDARLVVERLNAVVGGRWFDEYTQLQNALECQLTVCGVTRRDVGVANDPKSLRSDALKRAGVKFGIGVSIYAMSSLMMEVGADPNQLRKVKRRRKKRDGSGYEDVMVPELDAANRSHLKEKYEAWLSIYAADVFGPALGHGDQEEAQGVDDTPAQEADEVGEVVPSEEAEAAHREALEGAKT
jgi:hypothetical protein